MRKINKLLLFKVAAICVSICLFVDTIVYAVPVKQTTHSILRPILFTDKVTRKSNGLRFKEALFQIADIYFRPKPFEKSLRKNSKLYKKVIRLMKKLHYHYHRVISFYLSEEHFLDDGSDKSLKERDMKTRINETIHLFPALALLLLVFDVTIMLIKGHMDLSIENPARLFAETIFMFFAVVWSIGGIILHRDARIGIYKVLEYRKNRRIKTERHEPVINQNTEAARRLDPTKKWFLYRIGNPSRICPRITLQSVPWDSLKLRAGTL